MRKLVLVVVALLTFACTDEDGARGVLEANGFKDIEITGYSFTGCAESDQLHTGFVATNQAGNRVSGVVCCGAPWSFKGCTLRF